jgi:hypothetical protein
MNTAAKYGNKEIRERTLAKHVDLMNTAAKYRNKEIRERTHI